MNEPGGSRVDLLGEEKDDLMQNENKGQAIKTNYNGALSAADYKSSQFSDLLLYVRPGELKKPMQRKIRHLEVRQLRNITLGYNDFLNKPLVSDHDHCIKLAFCLFCLGRMLLRGRNFTFPSVKKSCITKTTQ